MASNIKLKKSSVAGKVPLTGDLQHGELAINFNDGYLYYKDASNNIKRFSDNSLPVVVISSDTTAEVNQHYHITTSGVTLTLPASPEPGEEVAVSVEDATDTVIDRNGNPILNEDSDFTIDLARTYVEFRYVNGTEGWAVSSINTTEAPGTAGSVPKNEYMVPIWAEENSTLSNGTYEWAFGNGADTPSNAGITIYVPSGYECHIIAMTGTTNNASGSSVIEANINGVLQGANCNVTLSGRSGTNDSFAPVSLSSGDRLTFRTTTAGTNASPNTVTAWLRYREL
jgi:hypothetical protein